ncbi:MAG: 4Fe-4S binding protein [Clostridia bacterium]|nr:4Fe-4S binding protein [Clostridia bacterium]
MSKVRVTFNEELCKGCELCKNACPKGIIEMAGYINAMGYHPAKLVNPQECVGCGFCALMCPDLVIKIEKEEIK